MQNLYQKSFAIANEYHAHTFVYQSSEVNKTQALETKRQNEILGDFRKELGTLSQEVENEKIINDIQLMELQVPSNGAGLASLAFSIDQAITKQYKASLKASGTVFKHADKPGNIKWDSVVRFIDETGTPIETTLRDPDNILQTKIKPGMKIKLAKEGSTNDLTIIVSADTELTAKSKNKASEEAVKPKKSAPKQKKVIKSKRMALKTNEEGEEDKEPSLTAEEQTEQNFEQAIKNPEPKPEEPVTNENTKTQKESPSSKPTGTRSGTSWASVKNVKNSLKRI